MISLIVNFDYFFDVAFTDLFISYSPFFLLLFLSTTSYSSLSDSFIVFSSIYFSNFYFLCIHIFEFFHSMANPYFTSSLSAPSTILFTFFKFFIYYFLLLLCCVLSFLYVFLLVRFRADSYALGGSGICG